MAIVIEYELTGIELLTRTQVIDAMKNALRRIGEHWHTEFAPKRFTPLGYTEYGFRRRTAKYEKAKVSAGMPGAGLPLVNKGEGRELTLSENTKRRIRVTRDKLTIPLPTKFNLSHPHGPKMSDEVRAVSQQELATLSENLVLFIEDELDKQVPAHLRNRGEIGGRVESLRLSIPKSRPSTRSPNPLRRRAAA